VKKTFKWEHKFPKLGTSIPMEIEVELEDKNTEISLEEKLRRASASLAQYFDEPTSISYVEFRDKAESAVKTGNLATKEWLIEQHASISSIDRPQREFLVDAWFALIRAENAIDEEEAWTYLSESNACVGKADDHFSEFHVRNLQSEGGRASKPTPRESIAEPKIMHEFVRLLKARRPANGWKSKGEAINDALVNELVTFLRALDTNDSGITEHNLDDRLRGWLQDENSPAFKAYIGD